ncbi:MAG: hypothetical protein IJW29_05250 [Clostridia bacterium]|nr:hypothetical protein [Clostridia bacterium]
MIFKQAWTGYRIACGVRDEGFPASVPGNIQLDYAVAHGFADVLYADGCRQFEALEDDVWEYRATLRYEKTDGERVFFVSHGIDYRYDILLDSKCLYEGEGIFVPVELDLTDALNERSELCVRIHPHPKRAVQEWERGRTEADHSTKLPVCYGWDWNPRLLISGMWQDAYVETRGADYVGEIEAQSRLDKELSTAHVSLVGVPAGATVTLTDADGAIVYRGTETAFCVEQPHLWWCNGQGDAYLYTWRVEKGTQSRTGKLGFRRVRLIRNVGAEDPQAFPKSRYAPPFTLELNGRRVFMKGSNFVNPDIFWGRIDRARYENQVMLAKNANMNVLRMWGGASVAKKDFYELCDEHGILVWQEFMLACNEYPDDAHYLSVLRREATHIIKSLRSHPCLAFWCGGNELFNGWSGMTDQSLPLRLLNSLCFELDPDHPFLATSPLYGMGHGGYMFYDGDEEMNGDVFEVFARSHNTAYTEFGIPSMASVEDLRRMIPEDELFPVLPTDAWVLHHGLKAWKPQSHVCPEVLKHYWGEPTSLSSMVEHTNWLQSVGYKASFEEMRRQWPHCSAALNWCFNEPWLTAANCSIISYPDTPKPAYEAVRNALRPVLFSARIPRFDWHAGERFTAGIWLLNDSQREICADVKVTLCIGDLALPLLNWQNATAAPNENTEGAQICCVLPSADATEMTLRLENGDGYASEYRLLYTPHAEVQKRKLMNQ